MKIIKNLLGLIFVTIAVGSFSQQAGKITRQVLFTGGENGYYTYRIPSMVATSKGTLLAFCAARKGEGGDWDPIDIVMRRSEDFGKTWGVAKVIAHRDSLLCDNAMPIVDWQTGQVHFLHQIDYAKVIYLCSNDDGKTFSAPVDITSIFADLKKIWPWVVIAPGPGHGIQLKSGRLVVPFWLGTGTANDFGPGHRGHRPSIVVSAYSDDHGKTWKCGDVVCWNTAEFIVPNETSCVELTDGRVMYNIRNESMNYRRLISYSKDGATGWSKPFYADAFFEPICFASMVRCSMQPYQTKNRILFCNPDSRNDHFTEPWAIPGSAHFRHRKNLTVLMSYDEGETWPVKHAIDTGIAGYSDLAVTPDGMIHCLYEGGGKGGNQFHNTQFSVVSFDLQWLTDGKDMLDKKDQPLNTFKK
jgi:sialidase-1